MEGHQTDIKEFYQVVDFKTMMEKQDLVIFGKCMDDED